MTTDKTMTLEQAIAVMDRRETVEQEEAWATIKTHLAPREVSDEDVERAFEAYEGASLLGVDKIGIRAALQAYRQRVGGGQGAEVVNHDHNAMRTSALLMRTHINDDAYACSFQSMAQYRTALIAKLDGFIAMLSAKGEVK